MSIIDRTIGWGHTEAYFSTYALLEGDSMYAGLPLSRRALFRAFAKLDEMGLIRRRRDRANRERVHFSVNIHWKPDMVNIPKRLQGIQKSDPNRCHCGTSRCLCDTNRCPSGTVYTVSNTILLDDSLVPGKPVTVPDFQNLIREESGTFSAPQKSTVANPAEIIREKARLAQSANATRQAERRAFGGKTDHQNTSVAVERAWNLAIAETFPGNITTAWGAREKSQAKQAARKWLGKREMTFDKFVEWSVLNWTAIMHKQFGWMTKSPPPAVPAWGFFIAMMDQFAECHAEQKLEAWQSDADRTEIDKIMARGLTYEQAMAQHLGAKAKGALRDEMQRAAIDANAKLYAAQATMERARKLADYAGNAPVHPRSRAAMQMKREAEAANRKPTTLDPSPGDFQGFDPDAYILPAKNPFDVDEHE